MITLIDRFIYPLKDRGKRDVDLGAVLTKAYQDDVRQLERVAYECNTKRVPVALTVYGSPNTDIRATVDCDDAITKAAIEQALADLLAKLNKVDFGQ